MAITVLPDESFLTPDSPAREKLNKFSLETGTDLTVEWIGNQFWLHSDQAKERPIGIEIDRELARHEDYFKKSSVYKELLAKALGIKDSQRPSVLDLTGGLLGDSLLMLAMGCHVTTLERHPVIQFLIQSALQNAGHPKLAKFAFHATDAESYLKETSVVDIIYFDPMFEDANHKAMPRKEMRIFRNLVGQDTDAATIFELARSKKAKRLVVKRPRHSDYLVKKPDVEYIGKSTRYDVYFSL